MKNLKIIRVFLPGIAVGLWLATSCVSLKVSGKSGAQLWGENCIRCHITPSPADYNDSDWETIGMHMRVRANLTAEETTKIIEFLQSAN